MAHPLSPFTPGAPRVASPGDPFIAFYREMNRIFNDLGWGNMWAGPVQAEQGGMLLAPHTDVSKTDTELRLKAELPGAAEDDIEVSLDDDVLILRAGKRQDRQEERQGIHLSERSFGLPARWGCRSRRTPARSKPRSGTAC